MISHDLRTRLQEIGKEAEAISPQIDNRGTIPDYLVEKLRNTGAFRLWVARSYGGSQAPVGALAEAVQVLSYYNGSLGWVLGVTGTAALSSGYLPPDRGAEIFADPRAMVGGWAAPVGRAKKVEGGIVVTGKWSWGSGIRHCTHIVGGVLVSEGPEERPFAALAYFDPGDVQLIDNWKVLGLKGTESIDYEVKDVFVPDDRWIHFPVRSAVINEPLYRFSFLGALATGVASAGLGLTRRAIDEVIALGSRKVPNGARRPLSERASVHEKIALLEARYRSARAFLNTAVTRCWQEAEDGGVTLGAKSALRLAATHAVSESVEVVSGAYRIGGGSAVWDGVKLQELLRDVHMVSQHGMVGPANYEIAGRVAFGQAVNEWLL